MAWQARDPNRSSLDCGGVVVVQAVRRGERWGIESSHGNPNEASPGTIQVRLFDSAQEAQVAAQKFAANLLQDTLVKLGQLEEGKAQWRTPDKACCGVLVLRAQAGPSGDVYEAQQLAISAAKRQLRAIIAEID